MSRAIRFEDSGELSPSGCQRLYACGALVFSFFVPDFVSLIGIAAISGTGRSPSKKETKKGHSRQQSGRAANQYTAPDIASLIGAG
jgi:hypothetical protein